MAEAIDMVDFIEELPKRRRGRACIVFTDDYINQKDWALKLARKSSSEHIDILDHFASDSSLNNSLSSFTVNRFYDFLNNYSNNDILIVTGLEFLKASWTGQTSAISNFLSLLSTWDKKPAILFVLQRDKQIEEYNFPKRFHNTFMIDQKETLAL